MSLILKKSTCAYMFFEFQGFGVIKFFWLKKIFDDYINEVDAFASTCKLYVCETTSSDGSPGVKKTDAGEGSQSSKSSNRSEQGEFSGALRRRESCHPN